MAENDGGEKPEITLKRTPSRRGTDVRDAVAEMTARAHEISQEAGSLVAAAMKDVIHAAAGLAGFAIESARDLVQYMVRRGQMTQEEADRLMREAEEAAGKRPVPPRETAAPREASAPTRSERPAATRSSARTATRKPAARKTARPRKSTSKRPASSKRKTSGKRTTRKR